MSTQEIWKKRAKAFQEAALNLIKKCKERDERISCLMMMYEEKDEEIKILKEENQRKRKLWLENKKLKEENEKLQHCKDLYIPDFEREQEENEKLWVENKKLKEDYSKEYDRGYKNAEIHLNHWILLGTKWEEWANDTGFHPCSNCGDIIGQQEFALLGDYDDICYNCEMKEEPDKQKN